MYIQDTWRPVPRLTATIGLRADFVERFDRLREFVVQNSVEIAPRVGGTFLITNDAKNVVRASFSRVHRQLMGGRDAVASFGTPPGSSSLTTYDLNGDGIFDRDDPVPAVPLRSRPCGSTRISTSRSSTNTSWAISGSCRWR